MRKAPTTIDTYLSALDPDRRAPLERLRRALHRLLPDAQECISYGMPAFRVPGGVVGGFTATKNGYSFYPFSGQTLSELAKEISSYSRTKSALHFTAKQPLPAGLLRKLVATRLAEIGRRAAASQRPPMPSELRLQGRSIE